MNLQTGNKANASEMVVSGQNFCLEHLDTTVLKHVASSMGLQPHVGRQQLLRDIIDHLGSKLQYSWEACSMPAAQPLAVYGFSMVAYAGDLYLFGGRWVLGSWMLACMSTLASQRNGMP